MNDELDGSCEPEAHEEKLATVRTLLEATLGKSIQSLFSGLPRSFESPSLALSVLLVFFVMLVFLVVLVFLVTRHRRHLSSPVKPFRSKALPYAASITRDS